MPIWMGVGLANFTGSTKEMRNDAAEIGGDAASIFTNAKAGRFMFHDPNAEDRVVTAEIACRRESLINVTFFAVITCGLFNRDPAFDQCDIPAFTAEPGFTHVTFAQFMGSIVSGQEI